jgi:hypothetical protein
MSTPAVVQGSVIQPSAMAGPVASAIFGLAQVLKDVIHNGRVYHSENDVLAALDSVDQFVHAFVKPSEEPALVTGTERAPVEDVSLRTPPPGMTGMVPAGPVIDYDKLAMALVRAQMAAQQPPVTTVVPTQETPVPSE